MDRFGSAFTISAAVRLSVSLDTSIVFSSKFLMARLAIVTQAVFCRSIPAKLNKGLYNLTTRAFLIHVTAPGILGGP